VTKFDVEMPPISWHATRRMREMGVSQAEVLKVLQNPDVDYPCVDDPSRRIRQGGRLAICYAEGSGTIITVLWRRVEDWERTR